MLPGPEAGPEAGLRVSIICMAAEKTEGEMGIWALIGSNLEWTAVKIHFIINLVMTKVLIHRVLDKYKKIHKSP